MVKYEEKWEGLISRYEGEVEKLQGEIQGKFFGIRKNKKGIKEEIKEILWKPL
jgi:hypothetical protein